MYEVTACLLIKDENEYLPEWLDWHSKVGIEHFYIYDNGSKTPVIQTIPTPFRPFCTIIEAPGPFDNTQIETYKHCLETFGQESHWMAFIDTDEFIRVVDGTDLRIFLRDYEDADAVAMRWITYNADGQWEKTDAPVRERFHQTVEYPLEMPQHKCIVNPSKLDWMSPHWAYRRHGAVNMVDENHHPVVLGHYNLPRDKIVVDHYFTKSWEEWQAKLARGSCDPNYVRTEDWFSRLNPDMFSHQTTYYETLP